MSLSTRKLIAGLGAAGAVAVGLGGAVSPASAQQQTYTVRLASGETVTISAPAGLSVAALQPFVPGQTVVEITSTSTPDQPASTTAPATTEGGTTTTTEAESPAPPTRTESDAEKQDEEDEDADRGGADRGREGGSSRDRGRDRGRGRGRDGGRRGGRGGRSTSGGGAGAAPAPRTPGGAPTAADPSFSEALPTPSASGVPNFFIDKFRIPPFLLPIYQAAGIQYGVRWEILAAINEIETDYGRNLNVSTAGAQGWMQFMPATWRAYGVDANGDDRKDPYNPVDAIFGAARYLRAAGADKDLRKAIFAYNRADWYVNSVLMRARLVAGLPTDLVGSLSGLTQAQFPVFARARYADAVGRGERPRRGRNPAQAVESEDGRRSIDIFADRGAPVIAVQDGRVTRIGENAELGKFVEIRDLYGNSYRYSNLGSVSTMHAVPKEREVSRAELERDLDLPRDPKPDRAATAGAQSDRQARTGTPARGGQRGDRARAATPRATTRSAPRRRVLVATDRELPGKERLFANPSRTGQPLTTAPAPDGGEPTPVTESGVPVLRGLERYIVRPGDLREEDVMLKRLRKGSQVVGGAVLGRIGEQAGGKDPHVRFEIRPAGRGAPRIDPKPILDGWKLLETSATYRAKGRNMFFGGDSDAPSIGQILLMSKSQLQRRVLSNPRVEIYQCGRSSIRAGAIDRRVLASIEFLAASGLRPSISSMICGRRGRPTASGNVSQHSFGAAVDIAKVNGQVISARTQGRGSITEVTIRKLLTLQGTMKPDQIISLMEFKGEPNTLAMGDHADHIHIGWKPAAGSGRRLGRQLDSILKPGQWVKLVERLGDIENPTVRSRPSGESLRVRRPRRG